MWLAPISAIPEGKRRWGSIFIIKNNFWILIHDRFSRAVEFKITVVVTDARHSGNLSGWADPSASVEDSEDGVIIVVEFRIGAVIANRRISIDWVSVCQRNTATDDAGRFISSNLSPSLAYHVDSAGIAVQVTCAGHDGINRPVSAIDSQDLSAQSLSPFQVTKCVALPES